MKLPDPAAFRSGRDFAAWLGLTPKDHSTGGRQRLGIITRAGDEALRRVLVAGAMSVLRQAKLGRGKPSAWLLGMLARKPLKLVIAHDLAVSPATVSRVLRRHGLSRVRDLDPPEPVRRYERERPGELIHIDIKKLGRFDRVGHRITGDRTGQSSSRGIGWEYRHLAIDDHSRLAYSEIHPDEQRGSCLAFLFNALRFFRRHGIRVERGMTDNGAAFRSKRYAKALRRLRIAHKRTRPYTPKTNGPFDRLRMRGRALRPDLLARRGLCPRL